ncbi:addiction module protein [candidate division KSB1 bacterium]|nr:addiction module protein [candidate division KSB1 bacterium]NIR68842.1 addiction module protein [candidate division KSB1 bacterium]NIS27206.1 addiction module protein [candidate division KSB1 bacterium]NIT74091.1 addiction module protein [candidate division KSB1 bacterium]NIU27940.1 addiction module protein [candidate division KSB1 bacterium]
MDITSQLNQMSTEEKLRTMELIWDDLCRTSDFSSPDWHKDILEEREKRIKEGKEDILDWEESKQQLKDSLS